MTMEEQITLIEITVVDIHGSIIIKSVLKEILNVKNRYSYPKNFLFS